MKGNKKKTVAVPNKVVIVYRGTCFEYEPIRFLGTIIFRGEYIITARANFPDKWTLFMSRTNFQSLHFSL